MVKRWEMDWTKYDNDAYMKADPDGEYVYYEDYAKLEETLWEFIEHEQLSMCDGCAPDNIQCSCGPCRSIDIITKAREVLGDA